MGVLGFPIRAPQSEDVRGELMRPCRTSGSDLRNYISQACAFGPSFICDRQSADAHIPDALQIRSHLTQREAHAG